MLNSWLQISWQGSTPDGSRILFFWTLRHLTGNHSSGNVSVVMFLTCHELAIKPKLWWCLIEDRDHYQFIRSQRGPFTLVQDWSFKPYRLPPCDLTVTKTSLPHWSNFLWLALLIPLCTHSSFKSWNEELQRSIWILNITKAVGRFQL